MKIHSSALSQVLLSLSFLFFFLLVSLSKSVSGSRYVSFCALGRYHDVWEAVIARREREIDSHSFGGDWRRFRGRESARGIQSIASRRDEGYCRYDSIKDF